MMSCSVYNWGSWLGKGHHCSSAGWALGSEKIPVYHALCVLTLSVLLLLLFFSFAVLLNCLYTNPQVFAFSSHSAPHPMEG